ncbi:DUF6233 domain-containing protein [Streptomyces canus]|uniref:DUF6233 domain-containing protein n=1 Tax=Streptomyces TaxID=1883 RepID=UPI000A64538B|nr:MULTISPECIES: DUF6233 domain-containing protein [Streptomyces]MDI5904806.1 DUF6233 domain-containing protein [Streptomyces sp. 12257]
MFDDLPPDLERLRTLRVWHALWLNRIDRKIALLERRKAEEEHGRRTRPQTPEWVVEVGIGASKPPVQVHAGTCHMIGSRRRPVSRDEARRLLADGLRACTHCQPDTQLHIIDLEVAQIGAMGHLERRSTGSGEHGVATLRDHTGRPVPLPVSLLQPDWVSQGLA